MNKLIDILRKCKHKFERFMIRVFAPIKRFGLKNKDFTIISNNCFGGLLYQSWGLRYDSPTIGLLFFSKEYLRFLSNLKYYIGLELKEVDPKESKYYQELLKKKGRNPLVVGSLGDVEICFLHYDDFKSAKDIWDRRKKRINYHNIMIKYNDQNLFEPQDIDEFNKLPFKNKVFFTCNNDLKDKENTIVFTNFIGQECIPNDLKKYEKFFNVKKYINSLERE